MSSFADRDGVRAAWPVQADVTDARLDYLLARASGIIRAEVPTVDDRLAAGTLSIDLVAGVTVDMVVRALRNPDGARTRSTTVGPFTDSVTYADADAALVLTDAERRQLLPTAVTADRRRLGTIRVRPCL